MVTYILAQDLTLYISALYGFTFLNTMPGSPEYAEMVIAPLVLLLAIREILPKSKLWNKSLATSLDMLIFLLLIIDGIVIVLKVATILTLLD